MANDTIIVVGQRREDEYGNLWVTPAGGGDEVKVASKRAGLHPLFQQGKAVMLHWETYKNIPYISDAKAVEGELPEPQPSGEMLEEDKEVIREARTSVSNGKNRSFALSYAKDWCIAKVQAGEDLKTFDVLVVAKVFESYLDTGIVVEKKKK